VAYRRPSIQVIQEFQQAAAALALPTLPACVIGPAYQIADGVNCGHYTGAEATFAYSGIAPGAIVDLTAAPADVAQRNVWKGVELSLENAYLVTKSGAGGAALATGDIDTTNNGKSTFRDPTLNAFTSFDPAAIAAPHYYVEISGGTGLAAADQGTPMTIANWKTQVYGCVQSLLFNNPHRVVRYRVRDEQGDWIDRSERPAPVRRLFETEAPPERTCLRTAQFVHHMAIPPGGRHDIHRHPHAEEVEYLVEGEGIARVGDVDVRMEPGDVVVARTGEAHGFWNTSETDRAVLVWCYGGAASLEEAGYIYEPD